MSSGNATGTVTIIGNPIEGEILEAQAVGIADPDGVGQIFYGWGYFDGIDFIAIFGPSTDPHYTVARTDVGRSLFAAVVFFDGTNDLETIPSAFTAPVIGTSNNDPTGVPIITGSPLVGETLTAGASSIADADGLGPFSYSWVRLKEGQSTVVGNSDTYTLTADDAHARFKVIVTYQDGGSFTEDVESALSASVASTPADIPPRIEFRFGDNEVNENEAGVAVGTLLFDGINDPAVTYTIVSDPTGRFEMNGFELRLTPSTSFDFEASATQQVQIRVTDGASLDYTETVTVEVVNRTSTPGLGTHPPITDPVVAADVLAMVFPSYGLDPLATPQWINEGTISFTFPTQDRVFLSEGFAEFARQFSATEQDMARSILASISGLVPMGFVEVPQTFGFATATTIEMAIGNLSLGILGAATLLPGSALLIDTSVSSVGGGIVKLGDDFHGTVIHEIGHALGLDHGTNSGATDTPPHLPLDHDRSAYSAMNQHFPDGFAQTYMMSDIAALQYLYGANFATHAGNTIYTWSETTGETYVNGVSMGAPFSNYILMTVWDGGGNDTYDASNYGDGVEIDLRPGEFSTISVDQLGKPTAIGNVGNAYLYHDDLRSLIENAIGGDGTDTLMGNVGDNRLTGNGGADDLDGGDGIDTAAFGGVRANYAVVLLGNGDIQVTDLTGGDGVDTVRHVERFAFTDGTFTNVSVLDLPPVVTGPVVLAPIAEDSSARPITQAELLDNASDADGPSLTAIGLTIGTGHGTLTDNNNGTWSYTPAADDDTVVTFTYQVTDGINAVTAAAALDITPVDETTTTTGTTGDDSYEVSGGSQIFIAGLGDDAITFHFNLVNATVSYIGNTVVIDGPSSHTVLSGFETFVFADGTVNNKDADPLVNDLFYVSQYHDVWTAHADPDAHYHQFGRHEGRDPDAFFSTDFYLAVYPGVKAAGIDPLIDFHQSGWKTGRLPSMDFDPAAFLAANPDVKAAGVDPLAHFLQFGYQENRQPIAPTELLAANGFDYIYYLKSNPDVAASGVDPFQHFQTVGWKEGRNPNALFDTNGYLAHYADVQAAHVNPLDHYNQFGWLEGRDPSGGFDTTDYLGAYADIAAAHINPLVHFLQSGIHEGRSPFADGVFS